MFFSRMWSMRASGFVEVVVSAWIASGESVP